MSTLWANGDRGLKSISCQQSSGQQSLTSPKKFTQSNHPLQEKIRQVCIFSQFCFIPGEQMSTLWANVGQGLKIDLGATKQRTVLFNLTQEVYPTPTILFKKKIRKVSIFSQFLFHSRRTNVHFMGKWRQGLKIDLRSNKAANSTL